MARKAILETDFVDRRTGVPQRDRRLRVIVPRVRCGEKIRRRIDVPDDSEEWFWGKPPSRLRVFLLRKFSSNYHFMTLGKFPSKEKQNGTEKVSEVKTTFICNERRFFTRYSEPIVMCPRPESQNRITKPEHTSRVLW